MSVPMKRMTIFGASFFVVVFVSLYTSTVAARTNDFFNNKPGPGIKHDDPYKVLGVKRTATGDDVQKAYRQRARETHPDKNSSPDANEEFRRVAAAFEILGDPLNRKRYDAKYNQDAQRRRRFREQERKREEMRRRKNEAERRERQRRQTDLIHRARATQGRMAKFTTIEEFAKTMLDSSRKTYKTHCLMMFVSNKSAEKMGDDVYHFPYPFAGEVGQYNSYSNLLQIRFNSQTDLTRLFSAKSNSNVPHIIFARKGDTLNNFHVFIPSRQKRGVEGDAHNEFKKWVESLHFIQATVANLHSLPVDLFIIRNGHVIHREHSLTPGYQQSYLSLHAGDRLFAFDTRLDTFPGATRYNEKIANTKGVLLLDAVVATSSGFYEIKRRRCYDLSTQCHDWTVTTRGMNTGQCNLNSEFMHHICPFSCGVCSEWFTSDVFYLTFHRPIHSFPTILRSGVRAGRTLVHDIGNVSRLRKNAAAAFFAFGLLVAFSVVLFRSASVAAARSGTTSHSRPNERPNEISKIDLISDLNQRLNLALDSILILMTAILFATFTWMTTTPAERLPAWLRGFRGDLIGVSRFSDIFITLLISGVIAGVYTRSLIRCIQSRDLDAEGLMFFIFTFLSLVGAMLTVLSVVMSYNTLLLVQWRHLWRYHKNAASVVVIIGAFAGVGFVSVHRLSKPLQNFVTRLSFPAVLSYVMILVAVGSLAFWDPHFKADIMHVLQLSTNAAIAFVVFGLVTGHFLSNFYCK